MRRLQRRKLLALLALLGLVARVATLQPLLSLLLKAIMLFGTCRGGSSRLLISSSKVAAGTKEGSILLSARFSTPATVWMFCLAMPKVASAPAGGGTRWNARVVTTHRHACVSPLQSAPARDVPDSFQHLAHNRGPGQGRRRGSHVRVHMHCPYLLVQVNRHPARCGLLLESGQESFHPLSTIAAHAWGIEAGQTRAPRAFASGGRLFAEGEDDARAVAAAAPCWPRGRVGPEPSAPRSAARAHRPHGRAAEAAHTPAGGLDGVRACSRRTQSRPGRGAMRTRAAVCSRRYQASAPGAVPHAPAAGGGGDCRCAAAARAPACSLSQRAAHLGRAAHAENALRLQARGLLLEPARAFLHDTQDAKVARPVGLRHRRAHLLLPGQHPNLTLVDSLDLDERPRTPGRKFGQNVVARTASALLSACAVLAVGRLG